MIYYTPASERQLSMFKTPFEANLDPENRWVKMASVVPWDDFARIIQKKMSTRMGRPSIDLRIVIGAILVKHIMNLSDEETILYIQENIYVQFFVGLSGFQKETVFTPSLFVKLRRRLGLDGAQKMNELLLERAQDLRLIHSGKVKDEKINKNDNEDQSEGEDKKGDKMELENERRDDSGKITHKGRLKLDATVAPQNIKYPTDVDMVNSSRVISEYLLDKIYKSNKDLWSKKPRTYRQKAYRSYVDFTKKRRKGLKIHRRERKNQLGYLRRNIKYLHMMLDKIEGAGWAICWSHQDWRRFWIIQEVYRQQLQMHREGTKRIEHRIVSVSQPYVRPIRRGKAGKETEFGAKLNVLEVDSFLILDKVNYENYNEANRLICSVEIYKRIFGYYPLDLLVDKIYLSRANRAWLKEKGIRYYGPILGRPPKMSQEEKHMRKKIQNKRSEIEGKFGVAKVKYGLDCIKMKREDTSKVAISLLLLAFNVFTLGQSIIFSFFNLLKGVIRGYSRIKLGLLSFKPTYLEFKFGYSGAVLSNFNAYSTHCYRF